MKWQPKENLIVILHVVKHRSVLRDVRSREASAGNPTSRRRHIRAAVFRRFCNHPWATSSGWSQSMNNKKISCCTSTHFKVWMIATYPAFSALRARRWSLCAFLKALQLKINKYLEYIWRQFTTGLPYLSRKSSGSASKVMSSSSRSASSRAAYVYMTIKSIYLRGNDILLMCTYSNMGIHHWPNIILGCATGHIKFN